MKASLLFDVWRICLVRFHGIDRQQRHPKITHFSEQSIQSGLIDDWSAARSLSTVDAVFEPDPARHLRALGDYDRFVDAYERLRSWFA